MTETVRRIKAYRASLPRMRERVMACFMLLVVSAVMMTSATFAWVTLSRSPEVSGVATTVAANGNLEIALSDLDGEEPETSQIGDSNKDLVAKNLTWGNLVNLSDDSYGLQNLVLRPASLNTVSLKNKPLYGASYGEDGRIVKLVNDFAYSNYDKETGYFLVPEETQYGVRAISSVSYKDISGDTTFREMSQEANSMLLAAQNQYLTITRNQAYMTSISGLMGKYLTARLNNASATTDCSEYIEDLYHMLSDFSEALETTGRTLAQIADMQQMIKLGAGNYTPFTVDTLCDASAAELEAKGVELESLASYKADRRSLAGHLAKLKGYYENVRDTGASVFWNDISAIVNFAVDINSCTIDGTPVGSISAGNASQFMGGGVHEAVITKGALWNMEKRLGAHMYAEKLSVKVQYIMTVTVTANVQTDAEEPFTILEDYKNADSYGGDFVGGDPTAEDTYGLAVDLWVRTNAQNGYLTLEGKAIKDVDGNVIGYEGENRVWDSELLTDSSTTQGNGSCYVFYADDPVEQAKSLELLRGMTVAFVGEGGDLLAYADMDTYNSFEEYGKVIVPLKLRGSSIVAGEDENGDKIYAITRLVQNEATRITALLYIDGTKVTNEQALEENDLQGRLNIQFGSTSEMEAVNDETLKNKEIHVTASADKIKFEYGQDDTLVSAIALTVEGSAPQEIRASFLRAVNATQGSKQNEIVFTPSEDGKTWSSSMTFTAPGTYMLRSVWADGTEYQLNEVLTVEVSGFGVASLNCDVCGSDGTATLMTAGASASANLNLTFASTEEVPKTVQGVFINDDNQSATANFVRNGNIWTSMVNFTTSGTYHLQYLMLDGEYYELAVDMQKTITVYLGMRARVWVAPENNFELLDGPVTLQISAVITDNKGNEMSELQDVKLYYRHKTSSITALDTDLNWDTASGRYTGAFLVEKAGVYNFASITVGENTITSATAPVITAKTRDEAAYHSNRTQSYQFAPHKDASVCVGIAYSETAESVSAVLTRGGIDYTVAGVMGTTYNESGVSVTEWHFGVPEIAGSQEGVWSVKELKLIGVYYNGAFHEDEVTWNMQSQHITSKVVNILRATVTGSEDKDFTGTFMELHRVGGLQVTVADYEGASIPGVSDVTLTYNLNYSDIQNYGYSSDYITMNSEEENPQATFSMAADSDVLYNADKPFDFRYAGSYSCRLSLKIGEEEYTTDESITLVSAPDFTVQWVAPDITVMGVNPAPETEIYVNTGGGTSTKNVTVHNYFEDHYVYLGMQNKSSSGIPSYQAPQVTLKLTDAGNIFEKATFTAITDGNSYPCDFVFSADTTEATAYMGRIGSATGTSGMSTRYSVNKTVSTLTMTYKEMNFTLSLAFPVQIVTKNGKMPELTFSLEGTKAENYKDHIQLPESVRGNDGRSFQMNLPELEPFDVHEIIVGDLGEKTEVSATRLIYMTRTEGFGCNSKTVYDTYERTVVTEDYPAAEKRNQTSTYAVTGWQIQKPTGFESGVDVVSGWTNLKTYTAGQTFKVDAYYRAVPQLELIEDAGVTSTQAPYRIIRYTDIPKEKGLTSKPTGAEEATELYTSTTIVDELWVE